MGPSGNSLKIKGHRMVIILIWGQGSGISGSSKMRNKKCKSLYIKQMQNNPRN